MSAADSQETTPRVWLVPVATSEQIAGGWQGILDSEKPSHA